jgi:hypothetical protein
VPVFVCLLCEAVQWSVNQPVLRMFFWLLGSVATFFLMLGVFSCFSAPLQRRDQIVYISVPLMGLVGGWGSLLLMSEEPIKNVVFLYISLGCFAYLFLNWVVNLVYDKAAKKNLKKKEKDE